MYNCHGNSVGGHKDTVSDSVVSKQCRWEPALKTLPKNTGRLDRDNCCKLPSDSKSLPHRPSLVTNYWGQWVGISGTPLTPVGGYRFTQLSIYTLGFAQHLGQYDFSWIFFPSDYALVFWRQFIFPLIFRVSMLRFQSLAEMPCVPEVLKHPWGRATENYHSCILGTGKESLWEMALLAIAALQSLWIYYTAALALAVLRSVVGADADRYSWFLKCCCFCQQSSLVLHDP